MELSFENKTAAGYRETAHIVKCIQETGEAVVPDTNDDIGKIVSVKTNVLLKSKDVTTRGVSVSGEAEATVLYITESADAVSYVRLSKKFTADYDVPGISDDARTRIRLNLTDAQARIINPRKISLTFSVSGELDVYTHESVISETVLPENLAEKGIHVKRESGEFSLISAAAERSFAVSEQFSFPSSKGTPERLVCERAEFCVNDTQLIGTKAIARGELKIEVVYLAENVCYPLKTEFSTPFSQIIETGEEQTDRCISTVELCSQYFDISDAVNGEKMLNAEIHAVLQAACYSRKTCSYISDAYSNLLPCTCTGEIVRQIEQLQIRQTKLVSDEKISISEDFTDILSILPSVLQPAVGDGKVSGEIVYDIVYRTVQGELSATRRSVSVEGECEGRDSRVISWRLADVYIRTDGGVIDTHAAVELTYSSEKYAEKSTVVSLELNEDEPYDFSSFPTVTIVRAEKNELWEYARRYHSSVEEIEAVNGKEENYAGKLLLIPKGI